MSLSAAVQRINVPGLAVAAGALAVWEVAVGTGAVDFEYLPAPSAIAGGFADAVADGALLPALAHTTAIVLGAWAVALVLSLAAGTVLGISRKAWRYGAASVDVMRSVPVIALVPVALLLLGASPKAELAVATYAAVWPIVVNTAGGIRGVQPGFLELARSLDFSVARSVRTVVLPAAAPSIVVGARVALNLALIVTIVAEMVGNPQGLGAEVIIEQQALQPARMWAYVATMGVLGLVLNGALLAAARRIPGARLGASEGL